MEIKEIERYRDKAEREKFLCSLEASLEDASELVRRIIEDEIGKTLDNRDNFFENYERILPSHPSI